MAQKLETLHALPSKPLSLGLIRYTVLLADAVLTCYVHSRCEDDTGRGRAFRPTRRRDHQDCKTGSIKGYIKYIYNK